MAQGSSFNFDYTCPKIDKAIDETKNTLQSYLKDCISGLCPDIAKREVIELANEWSEHYYCDSANYFEIVRKSNEEMRREANNQIDKLLLEIQDLKEWIKELERQLETLEK